MQLGQDGLVGFGQQSIFSLFLASAAVATALASLVASDMYEAAKMSTQVKSCKQDTSMGQWNNRQVAFHLICMHRPMGSIVNGTFLL